MKTLLLAPTAALTYVSGLYAIKIAVGFQGLTDAAWSAFWLAIPIGIIFGAIAAKGTPHAHPRRIRDRRTSD